MQLKLKLNQKNSYTMEQLMNIIESFQVDGFWGVKTLKVKFNPDLNFIIGPNGSGKTTAINLLAASLKCDLQYLYGANFDRIHIKLKTIGRNKKPSIEIIKEIDPAMGSISVKYLIKENAADKGKIFGVESPLETRLYRDFGAHRRMQPMEEGGKLELIIKKIVEANWLSIHRITAENQRKNIRDDVYESPIDIKLKQISRAFANYFSLLAARADEEVKNFQEMNFLSMLHADRKSPLINTDTSSQNEDRENLVKALIEMGVPKAKSTKSVDAFYKSVDSVKKKLKEEKQLSLDEVTTLTDAQRLGAMIVRWRELNSSRSNIFKPRTDFIEIMNGLLSNKTISFDDRNIPKIELPHKDEVDIGTLSSGEKQLFILLGEALLQEKRQVVFISDEPELSLHIHWQSNLFKSIREINPNCQVITATHSPDIVGKNKDKIIKIEECFQ